MRHALQPVHWPADFLYSLAPRHILRRFSRIDTTGDDFDEPRVLASNKRTNSELLNQDNFVSPWIIRHQGDSVAALDNLPLNGVS